MKRRAFIAGMFTTAAGLILLYEPKRVYSFPRRVHRVTSTTCMVVTTTVGDRCFMSPGALTIHGTDIHGNPVSEVIDIPPEGGSYESKYRYQDYVIGVPPDQGPTTIEFGIGEA